MIYNADLTELEGALAKDYEVSDDQLTYTFKLAEETWHDGQPFTSADVKFTFELARNAASGSRLAARLGGIASVETPDERTAVRQAVEARTLGFLSILTQVMILPEHALAAIAAGDAGHKRLVVDRRRSAPAPSSSSATSATSMSSSPPTTTIAAAGRRSTRSSTATSTIRPRRSRRCAPAKSSSPMSSPTTRRPSRATTTSR